MGLLAGGAGALLFALDRSVEASGSDAHSAQQEWAHNGLIKSYDHARYDLRLPAHYAIQFVVTVGGAMIIIISSFRPQHPSWLRGVQAGVCGVPFDEVHCVP